MVNNTTKPFHFAPEKTFGTGEVPRFFVPEHFFPAQVCGVQSSLNHHFGTPLSTLARPARYPPLGRQGGDFSKGGDLNAIDLNIKVGACAPSSCLRVERRPRDSVRAPPPGFWTRPGRSCHPPGSLEKDIRRAHERSCHPRAPAPRRAPPPSTTRPRARPQSASSPLCAHTAFLLKFRWRQTSLSFLPGFSCYRWVKNTVFCHGRGSRKQSLA